MTVVGLKINLVNAIFLRDQKVIIYLGQLKKSDRSSGSCDTLGL